MIAIGDLRGRVRGQPGEVARCLGWAGPQGLGVDTDPRDYAAHQGHEQQQVDRREPRRRIDVEKAEFVVDRPQVGCSLMKSVTRTGETLRCGTMSQESRRAPARTTRSARYALR